jgi:hypothetical protein
VALALGEVDVDLDVLDGIDLAPMLADASASADPDRVVFSAISLGWPMARCGPHKYIRELGWGEAVLFDVDRDPGEVWDLTSIDPGGETTRALAATIDRQLAATRPHLPTYRTR